MAINLRYAGFVDAHAKAALKDAQLNAISEFLQGCEDNPLRAFCLGTVCALIWRARKVVTKEFLDSLPVGPLDLETAIYETKRQLKGKA